MLHAVIRRIVTKISNGHLKNSAARIKHAHLLIPELLLLLLPIPSFRFPKSFFGKRS